ncbi:MAG: hypothetical protein Q4Q58_05350 [Thermoplasmata archaeon]|nr:hypothetical protein [Thermoplasmata archaeon]
MLIDERGETGNGKNRGGSLTFTMNATVVHNPRKFRAIYEEFVPGSYASRPLHELKEKTLRPDLKIRILEKQIDAGSDFFSVTLWKYSNDLPRSFTSNKGKEIYRAVTRTLVNDVLSNLDARSVSIYYDDHSSLKGWAGTIVADYYADLYGKALSDCRQLKSSDEPMLQLNDIPTGAVGRWTENGDPTYYDVIRGRSKHKNIRGEVRS